MSVRVVMMMRRHGLLLLMVLAGFFASGGATVFAAGSTAAAGPYQVELSVDPSPIPVGRANVTVRVTGKDGKPVEGAEVRVLAKMPSMSMGEKFEDAEPTGKPGTYAAPANFQMAGSWNVTVEIDGPDGKGTAVFPAATGASMGGGGGSDLVRRILYVLAAIALIVVLIAALRSPDSRDKIRRGLNRSTVGGVLLLVGIYLFGRFIVAKYRRPGAMSVLEAQAMDMSAMKPPVGAAPVVVAVARRGSLDSRVTYTGSAVAFVDEDVYPRVVGRIVSLPVYPGDRVRNGQLLVRLDSTELRARESEALFGRDAAEHQRLIAVAEIQQANAGRAQAEAELARSREMARESGAALESSRRAVTQSKNELSAARHEQKMSDAEVTEAREGLADAEAEVDNMRGSLDQARARLPQADADADAARAELTYHQARVRRSAELVKTGAISQEEYQADEAQFRNAEAKVKQSLAKVEEVKSDIRSAEARLHQAQTRVRQSRAKIQAAESRFFSTKSKADAAEAKVSQSESDAEGASARVDQSRAGVRAAQAMVRNALAGIEVASHKTDHATLSMLQATAELTTARTIRGYTEIRASVDGVVTQRLISPGVLVSPGMPILRVAQIDPIRFQANVADTDLQGIRVGMPVWIQSSRVPDKVVEAKVTSVFPAADPTSRTVIVESIAPNANGRFKPGEYFAMDIATGRSENAVLVPSGAIEIMSEKSSDVLALRQIASVWKIVAGKQGKSTYFCTMHPSQSESDKPGKCPICGMKLTQRSEGKHRAQRVSVQIGRTDGSWTEILSGVSEGDEVIVRGYEALKESDPVLPTQEDAQISGAPPTSPKTRPTAAGSYTCPMHPDVVRPGPGDCPKCGMKLVPKDMAKQGEKNMHKGH